MLQVAGGDEFAFRVVGEPTLTVLQQLFNFVIADPIMFVVVKHRDQDVQVRE